MRIAINIGDDLQGKYYVSSLIERQNAHPILLLVTEDFGGLPLNIETREIGSSSNSFLKKQWRLDFQLPSILKEWKADVLLNFGSSCSMMAKVPQILYIPDLMFLNYPRKQSWIERTLHQFYFQKGLNKARSIITPSEFVKQEIINRYSSVDASKIEVISKFVRSIFSPLDWEERSVVKDGYAEGREYFLFVGGFDPVKNLMNVLKAFSQFKKWQHSDMKLLITGDTSNSELLQKIQTYKFRDDVKLLDHVSDEQLSKLMAGAYAALYPSLYEGFGLPILEAMQSGTPVITSNNSAMIETGADAVLYVDPQNESEIAAQMIKLYKDEELRERLVAAGKTHAAKYNQQSSADALWKMIESIAN